MAMRRRSMIVAAFSTVVEWYDFTLYLYMATVLSRVFFGEGEGSLLLTLGGFAIAYLMRPLGAVVFGHVGDRFGRRTTMLMSVALITAAMAATAVLPTREQIGPAAGVLLILIRCVMGFSVGGEYTGVVAYLLEGAPENRRGLIASSASAASEIGALMAVGLAALTAHWLSDAQLDGWGWRIPFVFGAVLAGSVWLARSTMDESPDFLRQKAEGTVPTQPLAHVWRRHRVGVMRAFAISALGSITYYVGITYAPVFMTGAGRLDEATALWLATAAAVVVILVTPLTGLLSDRIGRRPVLIGLAAGGAVLPIGMFSLMAGASSGQALIGALMLAALAGGVSAVGAVATAEQFPGEGRLTGLALGATGATAIFGGFTPWIAELLVQRTGSTLAPGVMIAVVALVVAPILWRAPETAPGVVKPR